MREEIVRILIWGKTCPELSTRHVETVCTGGVREDGRPIRLYPVPLRYLAEGGKYTLYDWIEVPIRKSTNDPRPESFKVRPDAIKILRNVGTDDHWRERRAAVLKDSSWQF